MLRRVRGDVREALKQFPKGYYKTLYIDPPWAWMRGGGSAKGTVSKFTGKKCVGYMGATPYELMSTLELLRLANDVQRITAADAHLYLWTVNKMIPDAVCLVEAYGFRWITMITWDKGRPSLGKYFQGLTEHCVFGVRGSPSYKFVDGKMQQGRTLISERMRDHSRKPDAMYAMIERVSYAPFLELFARRTPSHWNAVGLELE